MVPVISDSENKLGRRLKRKKISPKNEFNQHVSLVCKQQYALLLRTTRAFLYLDQHKSIIENISLASEKTKL